MIRRSIVAAAAACSLAAPAAHAQTPAAPVRQGEGTAQIVAGAVETRITPNRPYSAESSTEMTQVLPDGNRISRTAVTKVYRDTAGRTRRETYASDGTLTSVSVSDPIAHASFTLDPKKKIAFRAGGRIAMPSGRGVPPQVEPPAGVSPQRVEAPGTGAGSRVLLPASPSGGRGAMAATGSGGPDNPNISREELGTQNVEGVLATGTRTTTIIPPGQIGNAQEIRVVSERWFSDELQVLVMTRHNDPRSGETVYRLRNIVRADPDPALFTVPSDYTVVDRFIRKPE